MPWTVCMHAWRRLRLVGIPSPTLTATYHSHTSTCITIPHTHNAQLASPHMHALVAAPQAACSGCGVQHFITAHS